jgi:hypothetical protein
LRTGLTAGRGRICQYGGMNVPAVANEELQRYGWRLSSVSGRPGPISAQAPLLGWLEINADGDNIIYLQAEATSHLLETSRSTSIGIYDQLGLARALDARGALARREKRSPILRKKGASGPGTQESVIAIHAALLLKGLDDKNTPDRRDQVEIPDMAAAFSDGV